MKHVSRSTMVAATLAGLVACGGCAATRVGHHDPLTFGMVKERLQAGVTTQQAVLETFGAPNIVTRNRDGRESWAYQRSAYAARGSSAGIGALGGGLPSAALVGGLASVWGYDDETSSHMVTLLVHFDAEGRVADYAMQESHF